MGTTKEMKTSHKCFVLLVAVLHLASGEKPVIEGDVKVEATDDIVDFKCFATGDPTPSIAWYNATTKQEIQPTESGGSRPNIHVNRNQGLLTIMNMEPGKIYRLYCNATNEFGHAISTEALGGAPYIDANFQQYPLTKKALSGDRIRLDCRPPFGYPSPTVRWLHNNKTIDENDESLSISSTYSLFIDPVKSKHAGEYTCIASNIAGVRRSITAAVSVSERAYITESPKDITVKEGEDAKFVCKARDNAPVEWKRLNGLIDNTRTVLTNSTLILKNVVHQDAGTYVCEMSGRYSVSAKLKVRFKTLFDITPKSTKVAEKSTVVLQCSAIGYPKPEIHWTLPSDEFVFPFPDNALDKYKMNEDGSLTIYNIELENAGVYVCNAVQLQTVSRSQATVEVIKSSVKRLDFKPMYPPIIELLPSNKTVSSGSEVDLHCKIRSQKSSVGIFWLRKVLSTGGLDEVINLHDSYDNGRISLKNTGTLQIKNALNEDIGNYTCIAGYENMMSMRSNATAMLNVIGMQRPELNQFDKIIIPQPTNFNTQFVSRNSIKLKWNRPEIPRNTPFYIDPEDISYQIEYYCVELPKSGWQIIKSNWKDNSIVFDNLFSGHTYYFLVRPIFKNKVFGYASVVKGPLKVEKINHNRQGSKSVSKLAQKIQNIEMKDIRSYYIGRDNVRLVWNLNQNDVDLGIIGGFLVKYREVMLNRCISDLVSARNAVNHPDNIGKFCSLSGLNDRDSFTAIRIDTMQKELQRKLIDEGSFENTQRVPFKGDSSFVQVFLTNLKPFRCYEYEIEPYSVETDSFGSVKGRESAANTILTYEKAPSSVPKDICFRWLNESSAEISWKNLPIDHWNGLLTSYVISVIDKTTKNVKKYEFIYNKNPVTIDELKFKGPFYITVSAKNCFERGRLSEDLLIDPVETSGYGKYHGRNCGGRSKSRGGSRLDTMVKIISIIITVFLAICVVIGCILCLFSKRRKLHKKNLSFQQNLHMLNGTPSQLSNQPILADKDKQYHFEPLLHSNAQYSRDGSNKNPLPPSYHSTQSPQLSTMNMGNDYYKSNHFKESNANSLYRNSPIDEVGKIHPHLMSPKSSQSHQNAVMMGDSMGPPLADNTNGYAAYNVLGSSGPNGLPIMRGAGAASNQPDYMYPPGSGHMIDESSSVAPYASASIIPNLMVTNGNSPRLMLDTQRQGDFHQPPSLPSPLGQPPSSDIMHGFSPSQANMQPQQSLQQLPQQIDYHSTFSMPQGTVLPGHASAYTSHSSSSGTGTADDTLPTRQVKPLTNGPPVSTNSSVASKPERTTSQSKGKSKRPCDSGGSSSSSGAVSGRSRLTSGQSFNQMIPPPPRSPPPPCPYENEVGESELSNSAEFHRPNSTYALMQ